MLKPSKPEVEKEVNLIVTAAISLFMKEDYAYLVEQSILGEQCEGISEVEDVVAYLNRNFVIKYSEVAEIAARRVIGLVAAIEKETYKQFNGDKII